MAVLRTRRYSVLVFFIYISILVLTLLTFSQLPSHPVTSTLILRSSNFRQDILINRPFDSASTLYQPVHAFLFSPGFFAWLEVKLSLVGHVFASYLYLAALVLIMFYLFFRLSRTGKDAVSSYIVDDN